MESYFTSKGIPYATRDIRKDQVAHREWRERYHGDMVPLIVFDQGKRIVDGCDVRAIERVMRELEDGGAAGKGE
ncbi:glutaredoxin family protein [Geomonas propionica]|uniref:Glutaredoxin domain-containing protein n=1 Tax=Geomonas propionica TaxID=2798582 RepID=A0ABS0YXJ2_9BACT|nr:hypothetical protein [Geomonas propionica]MBJ6802664.1 hypothetical protein [Geomonas propionica]